MATIVYRTLPFSTTGVIPKDTPLSNAEIDYNFFNLNEEISGLLSSTEYTAADVLSKLLTVDVNDSGLNATTLNGYSSQTTNTANTLVRRDASGNFAAGTITASLTGSVALSSGSISGGSGSFTTLSASGNTTLSNSLTVNSSTGTTTQFLKSRGTGLSPQWAAVTLSTDVTGTLPVTNGGTGATTQAGALTNIVGFTPVQQGGGTGQLTNKLYIGWDGARIRLQVDSTNYTSTWPMSSYGANNINGGVLGSIPYQSALDTTLFLAPNTTTGKRFLRQTGTGSAGTAPVWDTVLASDVGLGSVTNESKATMFSSPNFTGTPTINSIEIATKILPQNAISSGYTLALTDNSKHIYYTGAAAALIVPTNAAVPFPIGSVVTIINNGSGALTVSATGITLFLAGTIYSGNRIIGTKGVATLIKVATDTWFISGTSIT